MVNHGPEEADLAGQLVRRSRIGGRLGGTASCGLCRYREATPVVSRRTRVGS
jgi:hypothetical protein